MSDAPLLVAEGLAKHFPAGRDRAVRAVDGVSLSIRAGETLALVGESGCGKSTTGRLLIRLIEPSAGRVLFEGEDLLSLSPAALRARRRDMQIVFQDPYASLNPRLPVSEIIAEPIQVHGTVRGRAALRDKVVELLEMVGLTAEHARRFPHQFSGGQRQRIGIARAIAVGPRLVVADEPVSALDVSIQSQVVNLMQDLQEKLGIAYLFVAHDLAVVHHIADRVAVMYLGVIVETAPKAALFSAPHHPYTQSLLSAAPEPDPAARRARIILEGDVPSPLAIPPGCRFHTRCPIAQEVCRREVPPLRSVAPGHEAACHFARPFPIPVT
jgi:oligopeptide/dipeptide ABC transporter ATP-binding protein